MTWNELAANWGSNIRALMGRFPHADEGALTVVKDKPADLARALADAHDLTELEAREEIEDWMFLQSLARDAADIRTHDAALIAAE